MAEALPSSLVQIHYHDRPGGVRQVMHWYSKCFTSTHSDVSCNVWFSTQSGTYMYRNCTGFNVPYADYHQFRSEQSFKKVTERLTSQLF